MKNSLNNEPLSAITHLIAAVLSVAALVLMIVFAALYGRASHVVGVSIFGVSMITLYTMSTIYHFFAKSHRAKTVLQRLDHGMIYFLIAGTYTPLCLTLPARAWGWSMFGIIWALAITGFVLKIVGVQLSRWILLLGYLLMGWLIVIAFQPLQNWLPAEGLWWLIGGGIFYSLGTIFFILDSHLPRSRWFGMHEIFHLFVIAGSFCHFWLMLRYVVFI